MSLLHRARFTVSAARLDQLPPPTTAEVCFVGRSNSGKSSAINVLANQKRLAFSSKTPGRTRLINLFGIPDPVEPEAWLGFLVDLPGYGYAAIDQKAREAWADVLGDYLHQRTSLAGVVMVVDIRRGVTELDRRLAHWIGLRGLPTLALLTKADKLPYGQRIKAVQQTRHDLAEIGTLTALPFSATQRIGLDEAALHIENWISPQVVP
ncbi:MAG: YihA family ribosome biogenesis GTP-binding protein [Castellaniella sp.]|uniref:ribosome biogenesis GTP-binding protein YihA/YsxC n=1 Tax=Castellaniella sp. TaxID=1955812 RepID=UPI0011F483FA|nr:ribosome biogenesis GTP-binding protein YihA/YsxC [Castellaniella sp.]TAN28420.1 MAG: YihA family ribosome biogenesis GTP-binding protein [Castellaniella sp.]